MDEIESQSPLVGFLSGLRAIRSPYVFASACDLAFIEPNIIRALLQRAHDSDGAIPIDGELLEPLCAVYCREVALRAAEKSIESGEMSMLDMLTRLTRLVRVPLESLREVEPQLLSFRNINTGEDLAWATKMIQTRSADNL
jgi:molybdopterin-guanine dinucleotide biosynthesis protein A